MTMPKDKDPDRKPPEEIQGSSIPKSLSEKYRLDRVLGVGGFATVWLAQQIAFGRAVAVKILVPPTSDIEAHLVRFQREASLAASLSSQHIVKILDHAAEGERAWIVYELVRGPTLLNVMEAKKGPLEMDQAMTAAIHIARALEDVHALGMVHRDVKPANVLRDEHGIYKLADFGLGQLTLSGVSLTATGLIARRQLLLCVALRR